MKRVSIALIVIVLLVAGYAVFRSFTTSVTATQTTATSSSSTAVQIIEKHEATTTYTIDLKYPRFGLVAADSAIAEIIATSTAQFKDQVVGTDPADISEPYSLDISYDSLYQSPSLDSVELLVSQYTGGAHPLTVAYTFNFDPRNGKLFTLDDALSLTGMTLQQVASSSERQINAQFDDSTFPEGFAATPDNYSAFLINDKNVTFIFQEYQATAYAAGMPETTFPRKK